jgi:hypothetical protein
MGNSLLLAELQHATDHVLLGSISKPPRILEEKFRQNAIIWAGEDARPRLILLR